MLGTARKSGPTFSAFIGLTSTRLAGFSNNAACDKPTDSPRRGRGREPNGASARHSPLRSSCRTQSDLLPGGGTIEAGESEAAALIREVQEELGAEILPLRRLWRSVTPWNVDLAWWSARLDAAAPLRLNAAEVESVHWLAPEEILALPDLLASNCEFLQAISRGEIVLDEP